MSKKHWAVVVAGFLAAVLATVLSGPSWAALSARSKAMQSLPSSPTVG